MNSLSLSNSISKETKYENTELSTAYFEDLKGRGSDAISNERIQNGDRILETYEVTSDAISGGMGSVWRVHHQSWNTDLAMKRPQPRFFAEGGDERKKQFVDECEHWINLGLHPNIVSCYYVREIGGVPTIFSEWMDGGSLKDRITDGSLYEGTEQEVQERILDIAIQAARGLQYSHENGLIHQDMKPGNLLLSKDWEAKVADFGLAKAQLNLEESETAKTTGYTLAYCPKEQSDGEVPQRWMDVYAWALTVLEMYAGKRLWDTGAEVKENFDEYFSKCDHTIPDEMRVLLTSCINDKPDGFVTVAKELESTYRDVVHDTYNRKPFEKVMDIAASINNRALSFLDIGQTDVALQMLENAAKMDSAIYNPAKWNYYLLRKRLNTLPQLWGMTKSQKAEYEETLPECGEEIFSYMEDGDLETVCMHPLITPVDDSAPEYVAKPGAEEYHRMLSGLKEELKNEGVYGHAFKASAGYMKDNRILLGISASEREKTPGGEQPETMQLRLIDADTYEDLLVFEDPQDYKCDSGGIYRFANVGKVFLTEKYAVAINANLDQTYSGDRYRHQTTDLGIHVWDLVTGKYLRYVPVNRYKGFRGKMVYERIGSRYFVSQNHGDVLYTEYYEFHIPEGYAYHRYKENEALKVKERFPVFKESDKLSDKCIDVKRERILLKRDGYIYLMHLCPILPYTAAYIVASVRSSQQAEKEYETIRTAVSQVPELLKAGRINEALEMYQNVRNNYWHLGYNEEILRLNTLFVGHAYPVDFDEVAYSPIKNCVQIPIAREQFANGRRFWIEYTGSGEPYKSSGTFWLDGIGNLTWYVYDDKNPDFHPVFEVCIRENCLPDAVYPEIKDDKSSCKRFYLPEGTPNYAFSVDDDLIIQLTKPVLLKSDIFVQPPLRPDPREKMKVIPMTLQTGTLKEMYRLSLNDGSIEKIGEISGYASHVFVNGIPVYERSNPRGLVWNNPSWTEECISYDGRWLMLDSSANCCLLITPNWKWEPANGRMVDPFYTVESYEEKLIQTLIQKGAKLYEPDEEVPLPPEAAAQIEEDDKRCAATEKEKEDLPIVEDIPAVKKPSESQVLSTSDKPVKRSFFSKLFRNK